MNFVNPLCLLALVAIEIYATKSLKHQAAPSWYISQIIQFNLKI